MKAKNKKIITNLGIIFWSFVILLCLGTYIFRTFISDTRQIPNAYNAYSNSPDSITELYFENPQELPKIIEGSKKYSFRFTIRNLEGRNMNYPYLVYVQSSSDKVILDEGSLFLEKDLSKTISEEFGPLKKQEMKVVVKILDKNQEISFILKPAIQINEEN